MRILKVVRDAGTLTMVSHEYIEYADIDETLEAIAKASKLSKRSVESWLDLGRTLYVNSGGTIREYSYTN